MRISSHTTAVAAAALATAALTALLTACGTESYTTGSAAASTSRATTNASAQPSPSDNGVRALDAKAILGKAKQALLAADSFRFAGKLVVDDEMSFDVSIASDKKAKGWLHMMGGEVQVIVTPTATFTQGDDSYYRENIGPSAAQALRGYWVEADPKLPDLMLPEFTTPNGVVELLELDGNWEKAGVSVIDGMPVVGLSTPDATLWVASSGQPYPVRLEGKGSGSLINFSSFGTTVDVASPPADQVVPFAKVLELAE
jgi:hypothetical protein